MIVIERLEPVPATAKLNQAALDRQGALAATPGVSAGGSDMETTPRRRAGASVVPMLVGLLAAQRAAPHVRTVDFLLLFAGGVAFGVGLMGLIQLLRARRSASG